MANTRAPICTPAGVVVRRPIQALQVDGRFLTKKLTDLTSDEIRPLEQRVEMIEPDQGVLALTDGMESPVTREHRIT
jgi:hypothetical protein